MQKVTHRVLYEPMEKGSKEIKVKPGSTIVVMASGQFCAYGVEGNKRTLILGPVNANQRYLRYHLPADIERVYIKTEKSTEWSLTWSMYNKSEILDNTPVEMPVGYHLPETLADQMRRFIREEVSAAREDDQGSFEDEDDFYDEDPLLSPYEMTDMQEVEEILAEDNEPPEPPHTIPAKTEPIPTELVEEATASVEEKN